MASTSSLSLFLIPSSSSSSSIPPLCFSLTTTKCKQRFAFPSLNTKLTTLPFSSTKRSITRASDSEYKFPDPIPEFADSETEKFQSHLLNKLSEKDIFEESVEQVVGVCTEIFRTFLHSEYGGPGTLLVDPFIDMADMVTERGLPGGPQAARSALNWAHANVDKDWNEWTGGNMS
ncbi:protein PLASTID REDOX INSENSITIVE 2, chloroplastic [Lathyrus oleraceus]|uniref:Protein PLASTID REDOX INSENSITIVE 2, chloroplastic n=1 Tax=Pisum sativum TaxID=3888 RepID=A0A9D4XG83_PEA|nr:protein PLASTID REDOX INSENSITIVE 2, chloroplastic-like [Pisum sativum]KAI5419747.1 hypothetical protein KIW84_043780 [Pisum sativum]